MTSFYLLQRQNDIVSPAPMPKYSVLFLVPGCFWAGGGGGFQFAAGGGGGGGGEDRVAWPAAARWDRRSHMMSEIAAVAGDCGFGLTSKGWADGCWTVNGDGDLC